MHIRKYSKNLFVKKIDFIYLYGIRHIFPYGRLSYNCRDNFEEKCQIVCEIEKKHVPLQRISNLIVYESNRS